MRLLLDTHLLLWTVLGAERAKPVQPMVEDDENIIFFSVVSVWEVAIKHDLGRPDFRVDAAWLRKQLLGAGFEELTVLGDHVLGVSSLPKLHKDPFDRLLVAQAVAEGMTFLTTDKQLAAYPGPVRRV